MRKSPTHNSSSSSPAKVVFRSLPTSTASNRRLSLNSQFNIGDRVRAHGVSGAVAFVGPTKFAQGLWIGIILDKAVGKNGIKYNVDVLRTNTFKKYFLYDSDGSYNGVRYFETDPNRGLFCRPENVQRLSIYDSSNRTSLYSHSRLSVIEEASNRTSTVIEANTDAPSVSKNLGLNDRVILDGSKYGTLKYIGNFPMGEGTWCGIELDDPIGKHDGQFHGKRYFTCPKNHGLFAPIKRIEQVQFDSQVLRPDSRQSNISTSSYDQIHDSASVVSNISEISTSSRSIRSIPSLSSPKSGQTISSADAPTTTSLSSLQISDLIGRVNEKEILVDRLKKENDSLRLELSNSNRNINEMKENFVRLQQQCDTKEKANENLIQELFTVRQKVETLQFQLEERRESDLDSLKMPDNIQVFPFDEYEDSKEKIAQLESINQQLIEENQYLEQELKQQDKAEEYEKQIESLKRQISDMQIQEQTKTVELNQVITQYKQRILEYQSQIDKSIRSQQTTVNQESQLSDSLAELNRYRDSVIPSYEKECQTLRSELRNQESKAKAAIQEREKYHEEQLQEYSAKADRANHEVQKIRAELKQMEEINAINESEKQAFIDRLQNSYFKLQSEYNDLTEREYTAKLTISERESYYEEKLQASEKNLQRAITETQSIQNDLTKLEQEKDLHNQNSKSTIDSLKQDYEKQYEALRNQLTELKDKDQTSQIILNERVGYYEIQIKELQMKLDQYRIETESLRSDLTELSIKKAGDEKQLNDTISKLKYDNDSLIIKLKEQDQRHGMTLEECEARYQLQLKDFEANLIRAQNEKTASIEQINETINVMQQNFEKEKKELLVEIEELNKRERKAHNIVHQREEEYEQQNKSYEEAIERANAEAQHAHSLLVELQLEKAKYTDSNLALSRDLERLKSELQERDHTEIRGRTERDAFYDVRLKEYQIKSDQDAHEIETLLARLVNLEEEKRIQERQLNDTIIKLQHELESLKLDLEERNLTSNDKDNRYQSQIQDLQTEISKLLKDKATNEQKFNETIQQREFELEQQRKSYEMSLQEANNENQDLHQRLLELQSQEQTKTTTMNKREDQYQVQIKDLEAELLKLRDEKLAQEREHSETINKLKQENDNLHASEYSNKTDFETSSHEIEKLKADLADLREEKINNEQTLNNLMLSIQQDFESQIELLKAQNTELQEYHERKDQQIQDYQIKVNQLTKDIEELRQQNASQTMQLVKLQAEFEQEHKHNEKLTDSTQHYEQTRDELIHQIEDLTLQDRTLKEELHKLQSQDDNNQALNLRYIDLQKSYNDLLEKNIEITQNYAEEQFTREQLIKDKIEEYEMKIKLVKNDAAVELENLKFEYGQQILRMKEELQQAHSTKRKK